VLKKEKKNGFLSLQKMYKVQLGCTLEMGSCGQAAHAVMTPDIHGTTTGAVG
jgi:hypothetical protein